MDHNNELCQLYFRNHYKIFNGNQSEYYRELELWKCDTNVLRMLIYIESNLKSNRIRKYAYKSQLIVLNPNMKGFSRNSFYQSVNILLGLNLLLKVGTNEYLVNPCFCNRLSLSQIKDFNESFMRLHAEFHSGECFQE